jgi:hypothetical protein
MLVISHKPRILIGIGFHGTLRTGCPSHKA